MSTATRRTAIVAVLFVALAAALYVGTRDLRQASAPSRTASKTLHVTTSFYPLWYFASRIGGTQATVTNVTPAGAEPHDYEPTAQDAARIEDSDILVLNGGGLEAWGDRMRQNLDPKRTTVVTAGEGLTTKEVDEDGERIVDPHVWLSPPLAKQMAERIADAFAKADPANASYYQTQAGALLDDLDALNSAYAKGLASCAKKDIVTSHAAFGYLAATYGLSQVSIAGLSPDAEPSPKQLSDMADFVRTDHIDYIFFESLVSPKLSDTIAGETGAKTLVLDPIEGLASDDIAHGKDYLTEMRLNLTNLQTALQCRT